MAENVKKLPKGIIRRSAARLAAVQALYSHELGGVDKDPQLLALDLIAFYAPVDGDVYEEDEQNKKGVYPDERFLSRLVGGVVKKQAELDALISEHLAEGWTIDRVGAVLRAVLRSAIFELLECKDIPTKVIINEYIEVARAFFDEDEVRFTNGILDSIRKKIRD